jgi:hypothetical protein
MTRLREHPCRTCGAPVPPIVGTGRQRLYCELHRPARAAYLAAWQRANAAHVREYQRARSGFRAIEARTCPCPCLVPACAEPFRGWCPTCPRCRRSAHADRWQPMSARHPRGGSPPHTGPRRSHATEAEAVAALAELLEDRVSRR